jgi:hypothetical protein
LASFIFAALGFKSLADAFFQQAGPMTSVSQSPHAIDPVKLDKLAEVAIKVGLQLQKGQDLVITAPVAALPLVRRITRHAYIAGAGLVTSFYADEEATLARYENASDESFDRASDWLYNGMAQAFGNGAARLAVSGDNPMLLSGQDPTSTGTSSPIRTRPGRGWCFRTIRSRLPSPSWPGRSLPPRVSMSRTRSPPGPSTMPTCASARAG